MVVATVSKDVAILHLSDGIVNLADDNVRINCRIRWTGTGPGMPFFSFLKLSNSDSGSSITAPITVAMLELITVGEWYNFVVDDKRMYVDGHYVGDVRIDEGNTS